MSGDMGDDFRALRQHSQIKRGMNRAWSAEELARRGIAFVSKNNGAHLIVRDRVDFWPGTGRWIDRETPNNGIGIRRLIDYLGTLQ